MNILQGKQSKELKKKQAAISARQAEMKIVIQDLIEQLVLAPNGFTIDELGWATDLFRQWMTIRTQATKEHEEYDKVTAEIQEKFYKMKLKDLTFIYDKKATA